MPKVTRGGRRAETARTYALFHGSPRGDIESFDVEKAGTNTQTGEKFLFFTNSFEFADEFSYERIETDSRFIDRKGAKGTVYEVDVTMKKPLDLTNLSAKDVSNIIKMSDDDITPEQVKRFSRGNNQLLKSYIDLNKITNYGYDGFIAKLNNSGALEYAVVDGRQAKIKGKRR